MAQKKYWKDSNEYKRIIEILDDYWLTEKDEKFVRISMYFEHSNGESQAKQITWQNPDRRRCIFGDEREYGLVLKNLPKALSAAQFCEMGGLPFKEYVMLKYGCPGSSCEGCGYESPEEPWSNAAYHENPKHDFALDLARDDMFPAYNYSDIYTDGRHKEILRTYLIARGACDEALSVFSELYAEWEKRYSDEKTYEKLKAKGGEGRDI